MTTASENVVDTRNAPFVITYLLYGNISMFHRRILRMDGIDVRNSAIHSYRSRIGKRSSLQTLLPDLLMILSTVGGSTVHYTQGTLSKALSTECITK